MKHKFLCIFLTSVFITSQVLPAEKRALLEKQLLEKADCDTYLNYVVTKLLHQLKPKKAKKTITTEDGKRDSDFLWAKALLTETKKTREREAYINFLCAKALTPKDIFPKI